MTERMCVNDPELPAFEKWAKRYTNFPERYDKIPASLAWKAARAVDSAELTALRAERDALRVDANRYRFLKSHSRHDLFDLGVDLEWHEPTEGLDDAIDAALDRIDKLGEKDASRKVD